METFLEEIKSYAFNIKCFFVPFLAPKSCFECTSYAIKQQKAIFCITKQKAKHDL